MWFVRYKGVVMGSERHHGSSSTGFTLSCDYYESAEVIEIHPLIWAKKNSRLTLLDWKKLTDEDVNAYNTERLDERLGSK